MFPWIFHTHRAVVVGERRGNESNQHGFLVEHNRLVAKLSGALVSKSSINLHASEFCWGLYEYIKNPWSPVECRHATLILYHTHKVLFTTNPKNFQIWGDKNDVQHHSEITYVQVTGSIGGPPATQLHSSLYRSALHTFTILDWLNLQSLS